MSAAATSPARLKELEKPLRDAATSPSLERLLGAPAAEGSGPVEAVAARHPRPEKALPRYAPPVQEGSKDVATFRLAARPVACWRLNDARFEFDSSFVKPAAKREVALLAALCRDHPGSPASVFGHADPVGDDAYNKTLSGRRALAIYGLLVRDASIWERLAAQPSGGDAWGPRADATMAGAVGAAPGSATRAQLIARYMDFLAGDFELDPARDFIAGG
ncbi:MAG TPA: OmpA family protein, partial [Planctomycetota bacterium]|nr:OmpA family protein [Planctomycetota bacterium]